MKWDQGFLFNYPAQLQIFRHNLTLKQRKKIVIYSFVIIKYIGHKIRNNIYHCKLYNYNIKNVYITFIISLYTNYIQYQLLYLFVQLLHK